MQRKYKKKRHKKKRKKKGSLLHHAISITQAPPTRLHAQPFPSLPATPLTLSCGVFNATHPAPTVPLRVKYGMCLSKVRGSDQNGFWSFAPVSVPKAMVSFHPGGKRARKKGGKGKGPRWKEGEGGCSKRLR